MHNNTSFESKSETATLRQRLTPSGGVSLLLGCACLLAVMSQGVLAEGHSSFFDAALVGIAMLVIVGMDWALSRHYGESPPRRLAALAVAVHVLIVEAVTLVDGLTYTAILYLTIPFPAFFLLGRRTGLLLSGSLLAWFTLKFVLLKPGWLTDPSVLNTYLLLVISLTLIVAMAQVVQRERANRQRAEELLAQLEASHAQLARYAQQVAELATMEERNRLARDIHDSLGHYLTVVGVQLEKALIVHEDSPAEALGAVRSAKHMTDQALTDVRRSVGALREQGTAFRLRPALENLRANVAGLPLEVVLEISGDEAGYSVQQLDALYRAAQEGLTNIQKHARARKVNLCVELGAGQARLQLSDDGVGLTNDPFANGGYGLRGIRERLELVSGRMRLESAPVAGTQMTVIVPRLPGQNE